MNIEAIYHSGFVQRYAQNPQMAWTGQTLGHHQWAVTTLIFALFPDEVNLALIWEALHHDAGEMGSCDAAYPAKQRHPRMAEAIGEAEAAERVEMGIPEAQLTERETAILKLCDRLESYLFASVRTPWVLTRVQDWPELRQACLDMACVLGVGKKVEEMLRGVEV